MLDASRATTYEIASGYAYSPSKFSMRLFCKHFHVKEKELFFLFQKAIIEWIIPNEMVKDLKDKLLSDESLPKANKLKHAFLKNIASYEAKRKSFQFSKKVARFYTLDFAMSNLSVKSYAKLHHIPLPLFLTTMERAIHQHVVSEDEAIMLRIRALSDIEKDQQSL